MGLTERLKSSTLGATPLANGGPASYQQVTPEDLAEHGVVAAAQLLDVAASPEDAVANAAKYLAWATSQVLEGA